MKTLLSIVLLLCSELTFCQPTDEIDSLIRLLSNSNSPNKKELGDINARLGWDLYSIGRYDSSILFYRNALKYPSDELNLAWRGTVHLGIGSTFSRVDKIDSALEHFQKALALFTELQDINNIALSYGNLAVVYKNRGLYEEALENSLLTLQFLDDDVPSVALGSTLNNIGNIYVLIQNYPAAVVYYRKAFSVLQQLERPLDIARCYNNLGDLFTLTHHYYSAKHYLTLSSRIKREQNDTQGLARTLTRLGKVLVLTNDFTSAETQLKESLDTQRKIDDAVGLIETMNNLGELYLKTNRLSESSSILSEANTIIHKSGTPDFLRQNLELKIELARKQKEFATGMTLLDELLVIRDSLLNEEKSKSLQAMQIRYETQKKEQEITLLHQREEINQAKIASNKILIIALVAGILLFAAIGILIYINLRNARAAKQRFELLLSETRHRIKNNLQTLASIFHLQTRHYTDQEMVFEARSSESRVHTMSLLHEKFYGSETDHISTQEYITDLIQKLVDIYGFHTRNLKVKLNIQDVDLDIDKALALSLIIQELVCNAFKYAFEQEPNPELLIEVRPQSNDVVTTIGDNGVGLKRKSKSTSQGLSLVDALVSQLDGRMDVDSQRGTIFTIRFPATSLWKKPAF